MTADPSCCVPGDSVAIAAQIMKREDVGPVLVVSDHSEKRLVGIVTDRDLVIKVLADGRSPHDARVDQAMSANPVACQEDDDVNEAMRKMSTHQVRRIPVVDDNHRLVGIIAQADLALHVDEEDVGELVEDISQPFGESDQWTGGGLRPTALKPVVIGALCFGAGMGLAYLLGQPRMGTRRDSGL
jgi:CBS domain-containing protein